MELIYDIAVLIMFIVFCVYFFYIKKQFGILDSISNSFYELEKRKRNSGWWFMAFAWGLGFPMIVFLYISVWFIIPILCVLLLGAAPQFKRKLTNTVHVFGALGSLVSALILIGILFGNWWCLVGVALQMTFTLAIGLLKVYKVKNFTTWTETAAFMGTCVGLWIR